MIVASVGFSPRLAQGLPFYQRLIEDPVLAELVRPSTGAFLEGVTRNAVLQRFSRRLFDAGLVRDPIGKLFPYLATAKCAGMHFTQPLVPRRFPKVTRATHPKPANAEVDWENLATIHPDDVRRFPFRANSIYIHEPLSGTADLIICGLMKDGRVLLLKVTAWIVGL